MRARSLLLCLLVSAVHLAAAPALAEDTLRCGSRLVRVGDGKDKVVALCGEPTSIAFEGIRGGYRHPYGRYDFTYFGPVWIEVPVELWTYNLGRHKLLRKLRFFGDELVEIWTDGYGY